MNVTRAAAAILAASAVYWFLSFLVNIVLFRDLFSDQFFYRPPDEFARRLPLALGAMPIGFAAFVTAFAQLPSPALGVAGGIRAGFVAGVLLACLAAIPDYVAFPLDWRLGAIYMITPLIRMVICGAVVGAVYRS